jgi:hypothetical protein
MASLCDDPNEMPTSPMEDPERVAYIILGDSSFDEADGAKAQAYATLALVRELRNLRRDLAKRSTSPTITTL